MGSKDLRSRNRRSLSVKFLRADVWSVRLGIKVSDFRIPKSGLSSMGAMPLYAFPLESHQEDLDRKKPSLSDEAELIDLITEGLPDSMSFYYEKVMSEDERIRAVRVCVCVGGRRGGVLEIIAILEER